MATRKKTDVVQLSKIRMREALRAKLARDAEEKGITLNAEIVDRLEGSYKQAARDAAIIDMMVDNHSIKGKAVRLWASEMKAMALTDAPNTIALVDRIRRAAEVFKASETFAPVEPSKEEDK
jgi:hypothetical protein